MKTYKVTVDKKGNTCWYNEEGQLHRDSGPAREWADGSKSWWVNGQRHREDGPAVEGSDDYKAWWVNDQRHREDGPAREWANGDKEYWIKGNELTEEEFNNRTAPAKELTVAQLEQILGHKVKIVKE